MRKIIIALFVTFSSAFSQNPNWSSFITFPSYPTPYIAEWERNPNIGSLTLNYTGTTPVEFYFEVVINIDGYGEGIRGRTELREYTSGPMAEMLTFNDFLDWESSTYNKKLENLIIQSGKLPEATYSVCVTTYAKNGSMLTDACTEFDIVLPDPPQLISPEDEGSIQIAQPSFLWNPVSAPIDISVNYQLKIVEVLKGQTAYRALEANVPVAETEVKNLNVYTYSLDDYPLEKNHTYVWQIKAIDDDGLPISSNNGLSEIWQFTYGIPIGQKSELKIDTLTLIEDFAYLIDLNQLDITDNNTNLNFNGSCRMLIKGSDGADRYIDVDANNLILQKDSYDSPMFLGGNIIGTPYDDFLSKDNIGEYFQPTEIEFLPPQNLTVSGEFYIGADINFPLTGKLLYVDSELTGRVTGVGSSTSPLFSVGDESFKMDITSVEIEYPSKEVKLDAGLSMFGTSSSCSVTEISLDNDGLYNANVSCDVNQEIALLQSSTLFNLSTNNIKGRIFGNLLSSENDYNILIDGSLDFNVNPTNRFGADVTFELKPNNFNLISFNPSADVDASTIDFGWVKWNMQNMELNNLVYQNSTWDFELAMDINLSFPDFDFGGKSIPTLNGITFTPTGFKFPKTDMNNFSIPHIDFTGFELELYGLHIPNFNFDFADWTPGSLAKMDFNFDVNFSMPNLPNGTDEELKFPKWNFSRASISNGNFSFTLPTMNLSKGNNIPMLNGINFNVTSFEGKLNTEYNGSEMNFLPDVNIGGEVTLPEALQCDSKDGSIELETMVNLNGDGSISGTIEDVVPKCPINIGLAELYMKDSKVEFIKEDGQKIFLKGKAGIKFSSSPGQTDVGTIDVVYDVLENHLIKADGNINEKFRWDLVGDNPTFSFNINEATVSDNKLKIDGRSQFIMKGGKEIGATFDKFSIALDTYTIEDGRVIFDESFAMVISELEDDKINYKAVSKGDIPKVENYLYFELPEKIALNKDGFTIIGKSKAQLNYQGRTLEDLFAQFSDDFSFSLSPFKVKKGKCEILLEGNKVAYFNSDGFFPDPNYFINRVVPERIPLPSLDIAYLQIKSDDNLLVDLRTEGSSTFYSTRAGEPVELVFPSLQFDAAEAPKILVSFNIAFDNVTGEVTNGFISGTVPEERVSEFDLSRVGIPFSIYSIYYGNIEGFDKFRLTGIAKLFETDITCQDSMTLTLSQNGMLEGNVNCEVSQLVQLIPDSDKLNLQLNNISGNFNADLLTRNFDFDLQLDSDLRFKLNEDEYWGMWTLLNMDFNGVRLVDSRNDDITIPQIDLEDIKLRIKNLNLGMLTYNSTPTIDGRRGWDFEFAMDLDFSFPGLGLELPNIPNVILNRTGFHTRAAISVPSFSEDLSFEFQGFEIKPLAFRMPKLDFNWFNSTTNSFVEGFKLDFEINFPNLNDASSEMRYPNLTMRDVEFRNGILIGDIEIAEFDMLDNLKLNFGGSLGFSIKRITGGFFDAHGSQGIGFGFNGDLELPEYLRCDGEETSVDLTDISFALNSSGNVAGLVENFVPRCPIDLGFGHFQVSSSTINFSVADAGQAAVLDMTGDLVVDTGDENTVTANGTLQMDLLTGQITEGSITIEEQFVLAIPNKNPVLRFSINRAVLNKDGLMINGDSELLLPDNQTRTAHFENFIFDYRNSRVKEGSLEIDADFAIKLAIESGDIVWSTIAAEQELTENKTAKIGFTSNLILDVNGLSTNGEAIAAIRWDEDPEHQFGNLSIRYTNNFKFSLKPFMVSEGRADLIYNDDIIATLSHDGLNLGDIFGLLPLPEVIPLPDREIAYLRIKNGDRVLVESETVDGGLRVYSTADNPTSLLLPALQYENAEVDSIQTIFDVVINPSTGQIVSGEIILARTDSSSILNLRDRGIPIDLYKIHYGEVEGNYQLTADAKVDLPGVMDGIQINMHDISFTNNGLSGRIELGTYSENFIVDVASLKQAALGEQAIITIEGLDVSFGDNNTIGFSGKLIPTMLVKDEDTTKIQYAANWNNEEHKFGFSFDFADDEDSFDFGIGTFRPISIGENPAMKLTLMENDFEFLLNGEFEAQQFGDDFAITIEGLKITKNSVTADDISKPESNPISFNLFNSEFRIFDPTPVGKAISFTYRDGVLKLVLSGELDIFDKTVDFTDFTIGTDGTFSIGSVNLLNEDLVIVNRHLALNRLGIVDNKLDVGGWIKLPEPVRNDNQFDFGFNIDAKGKVTTDERFENRVVLINEPQEIGGGDVSEYDFWKTKFDITYLALNLNFSNISKSSVQMISDIYWNNDENKKVEIGNKSNTNEIIPGLEIKFDGNIKWKSTTIEGDLFSFDEEMFNIEIKAIKLSADENNNLTFGINGRFGLNFNAVEGGLKLENFEFNKTGIVNFGEITEGDLRIAGVGSLALNNINYSETPTEIWVKGGETPSGSSGASADSNLISVDKYLSFGGEISIEGLGSAGVDRFLSYSTDGSYTLLVRNAHFEIENKLSASIDLVYHNGSDGFMMRAAGRASIKDYDVIVVGKIAKIHDQVSWGFFIAADMTIPLGPVVITSVGGGFFYNPTSDDILTVKRIADVGEAEGKIEVQDANFAVFLFGEAVIINDALIAGRVLLTLTDRQFMLDGRVILLDMENKIEGEVHLMVQKEPTFEAEGEITIDVTVPHIVQGDGRLGFYVYSSEQWAIYGNSDFRVFNYLQTNSDFFIGNSGFMLGMSSSVNFDIWIIEVGAGIDVKLWKLENTWGAYAKAWVKAEMLLGVAKATGWLNCALLGNEGNTYLYGQAGLEIHTILKDWKGSAWAKIENGSLSGGRGSDSDMDALITEAAGQSAQAEREMDDMKTSVESRSPTLVEGASFSQEDLQSAFSSLTEWGTKYRFGTAAERQEAENFFAELIDIESVSLAYSIAQLNYRPSSSETNHYNWVIDNIYKGGGAPNLSGYETNRRGVLEAIEDYDEKKNNLLSSFQEAFEVISTVESETEQTALDPTRGTRFARYTTDENGDFTLVSSPSVNVDEAVADQNRRNLNNGITSIDEYRNRIYSEYEKLNTNIAVLENTLRGNDGVSGAEGFSRSYNYLTAEIQRTYLQEYLYYKKTYNWALSRENELRARNINDMMLEKARHLYDDEFEGYLILKGINVQRVEAIAKLRGDDEASWLQEGVLEAEAWDNNIDNDDVRDWAISQFVNIGNNLWNEIAVIGLQDLSNSTGEIIGTKHTEKIENIELMGHTQHQFTTKMNTLYSTLATMSETKYDILSKLIEWEGHSPRIRVTDTKTSNSSHLITFREEKTLLEEKMTLPSIIKLETRNYDFGLYSSNRIVWNVSGTRSNNTTYMIDFSSNRPNINNQGFQSIGNRKSFNFQHTPIIGQSTFGATNFLLKARNEVGYTIHRNLSFTPTFSNSSNVELVGYSDNSYEVDTTPPRIVNRIRYPYIGQPMSGTPGYTKYYTCDPSTISAEWTASDNQSGIQEYRYNFARAGVTDNHYENWTNNFGRNDVVLQGLDLHDKDVFVLKVAAKNGEGLWTTIPAGTKQRIIVDLTPPSTPRKLPVASDPTINVSNTNRTIRSEVELPETVTNTFYPVFPLLDNSEASTTVRWYEATDQESGIYGYEISVSKVGDESIAVDGILTGHRARAISLSNNNESLEGILTYVDSFYVDVRAINKANNRGGVARYKVRPFDSTPPSRPIVNYASSDDFQRAHIVFSRKSVDEQCGIQYYEVGVGRTINNISFEDGIKILPSDIGDNNSAILPELSIQRGTVVFAVRAVNKQGTRGEICYTGHFRHDSSPPPRPDVRISYTYAGSNNFLNMHYTNVFDEQSGIDHVEYRIFREVDGSSEWSPIIEWQTSDNINNAEINLSTFGIGENIKLKVYVRSMNRAGLLSLSNIQEYHLPDRTPPIKPDVTINSVVKRTENSLLGDSIERIVKLRFTDIEDPESGIKRIEYKIEKTYSSSDKDHPVGGTSTGTTSIVSTWQSNGTLLNKRFLYSRYNLRSGETIKVSVRTFNNDTYTPSRVRVKTHLLR